MSPKNWGGSAKFPGGHKVIHRTAQTAFVRVVTPRYIQLTLFIKIFSHTYAHFTRQELKNRILYKRYTEQFKLHFTDIHKSKIEYYKK